MSAEESLGPASARLQTGAIKAGLRVADIGDVISARADRSWRWYRASAVYLPLVGGVLMFLAGALSWGSATLPLLVIGGFWIAIGFGGVWQWRRVAREMRLENERMSFVFPDKELTIPAADIVEIRRPRGDMNHWLWLRIRTTNHGTIRVAARLRGLVDLLAELRRLNPRVTFPDF